MKNTAGEQRMRGAEQADGAEGSRGGEELRRGGTSGGMKDSLAGRFSHATIRQRNKYSLPPAISRAR